MTFLRRTLCLAATAVAAATTAAVPAQAAPDWTPAKDLGDPTFFAPQIGYTAEGVEIGAHVEQRELDIPLGKLVATSRAPGGGYKTELVVDPEGLYVMPDYALDVAPNGAAVLVWEEVNIADLVNGPHTFRASYRTPGGTWGRSVLIGADTRLNLALPSVTAAIGDDGTAVAGASHLEEGPDTEFQPDFRTDVRVHPASGDWDAAKRLSADNQSATELRLGVDADGRVTAAYPQRSAEGTTKGSADDVSTVLVRRWFPSNGLWTGPEDVGLAGTQSRASKVRLDVAPSGRAAIAFQASGGASHFSLATRRATASAAFDPPDAIGVGVSNLPLAVGVAPDGTTYALLTDDEKATANVTRAAADGPFSVDKPVGGASAFSKGAIAFRGNDAFFAWDGFVGGVQLPQATTWRAGDSGPESRRDLDDGRAMRDLEQLVPDRDGGVVAVWSRTDARARHAAFDGSAPRAVDASVPSAGEAGAELAMTARFADLWSPLAGEAEWDFGDGVTARGDAVRHAYAAPGDYTVTLRSRDTLGNARTRTFPVTISAAQPQQSQPPAPETPAAPAAPAAPSDTIAPTVKLKQPAKKLRAKRAGWQTLRGTIADAQPSSGIKRVEVTAFRPKDKRTARTAKLSGANWKLKLPKLTRGTWTFRVRVVDNAGNASKTIQKKVRLR